MNRRNLYVLILTTIGTACHGQFLGAAITLSSFSNNKREVLIGNTSEQWQILIK